MNRCIGTVAATLLLSAPLSAQTDREQPRLLDTLRVPARFATVFGQRIAYYEAGLAAAPVVILIPTLRWDAHAWAQNLPELARSFRVIAIDPLGTGRSDKPLIDYKMGTWTDTFAEFLRRRGIREAAWVGAEMGGALAVQMALDYPQQVTAIVVAGSNTGPGVHEGGLTTRSVAPTLAAIRTGLEQDFFDRALVTDSVVRALFTRRLAAGDGYTIQRHLADHRPRYTIDELAQIPVPALFVWCREDRVTPLSWGADYAKALRSGVLEVLERCGHYPNLERPHAFNQAVLNFLRQHLRRGAAEPRSRE